MKRLVPRSRTMRTWLVAGLLVAAIVAGIGLPAAEGGPGPAAGNGVIGVYAGSEAPSVVSSFGQGIGEQPAYAMDFLDGDSWSALLNTAPTDLAAWVGSGYSMIWGVPILPKGTQYSLADGAAGDYDSYFLTLAQDMVAGGQGASIVRLGWEFNGGWFPWAANGQAAAFIGYWQQIVDTMRSVPGQDFKFEWNPTAGDLGVGDLADYYPGSAYVDSVGLDVYDQNWASYPGAAAQFSNLETEPFGLDWLASFAASNGKPITLPEWGLGSGPPNDGAALSDPGNEVGGGDDPTFINDMAQWIEANHVSEATFWDFGSSAISPTLNPNSYSAFVSDFGSVPNPPSTTTTATTTPAMTAKAKAAAATATSTPSSASSRFPIAVWLQDPAQTTQIESGYPTLAAAAKAEGINTFLGLYNWPSAFGVDANTGGGSGEFQAACDAGEYVVAGGDPASNTSAESVASTEKVASDETQAGTGTSCTNYLAGYDWDDEPTECSTNVASQVAAIHAEDPTRPTVDNMASWVTWGDSGCDSTADAAFAAPDITSSDDYHNTDAWNVDNCTAAAHVSTSPWADCSWLYGYQGAVQVSLAGGKPTWEYIETGTDELGFSSQSGSNCDTSTNACANGNEYNATAPQVNADAWDAILNGVSGIEWFCHGTAQGQNVSDSDCMGGNGSASNAIFSNLSYIDGTIQSYAPELLSPTQGSCTMQPSTGSSTDDALLTSCSGGDLSMTTSNGAEPIVGMTKVVNGTTYLFVEADRANGTTTGTYRVSGAANQPATLVYDSAARYDPAVSEQGATFTLNASGSFSDSLTGDDGAGSNHYGAGANGYQVKIYAIGGTPAGTTTTTTAPPSTTTTTAPPPPVTTTTTTSPPPTTTTTRPPPPVTTTTTTSPPPTTTTTRPPPPVTTTTTTSPSPTTTTTRPPPPVTTTTTTTSPATTTTTSPPTTTTTTSPAATTTSPAATTTTTSPSTAAGGAADPGDTVVTIEGPHGPVITAQGAEFAARISHASPRGSRPSGTATWHITSASGAPVPCRPNNQKIKSTGTTICTVAPHQLYAADGPYTVSVAYPGGGALKPATASIKQSVVPARSSTRLRVTTVVPAGKAPSVTALVLGLPISSGPPRGSVRFTVAESSGKRLQCRDGDTVSLSSSGKATCTLAAAPQKVVLYVSAGYRGDGNFAASASPTRSVRVKRVP